MPTKPLTAAILHAELQAALDETRPAIAAADAIPELRRKVELLRETTRSGSDAEADKAATELVKATQLLQQAEIVEERKAAAKHNAIGQRASVALSILRRIESHFGALSEEACDLAHKITLAITSPAAMAIRADQDRRGATRDALLSQVPGYSIGTWEAWEMKQQAHSGALHDARVSAVPNAEALIAVFDQSTATIKAQIERLRSILAVVVPSTAEAVMASAGEVDSLPGATVETEELATV